MGPVGIVLGAPVADEDSGFEEAGELLDGEQLVAHPAAVRVDSGVLPGRARLDVLVPGPVKRHQSHKAFAVSSGPLSQRTKLRCRQRWAVENAASGSLLRQHFLHNFSEEVPTGERGIRTSEKTPSLTLTE